MMNPETTAPSNEPELDIRGLCRTLWYGKYWIIALALLFAGIALSISYVIKPAWVATAVIDKPAVNAMSGYYSQRQFLRNFDKNLATTLVDESLTAVDKAYREFIIQLASWDTRRDFWLMTDNYKQRHRQDASDAKLLNTLINSIQFIPRDDKKILYDNLKLTAETAVDAHTLLQQYVEFTRQRSVDNLNAEMQIMWREYTQLVSEQIKWQEAVAWDVYHRELKGMQQILKTVADGDCLRERIPAAQIPIREKCLTEVAALQSRLNILQATGPRFDINYSQNQAMLTILTAGLVLDANFQPYRYLRTPDSPVEPDSPRRIFLFMIWGSIGALAGAGVALMRCAQR